MSCSSINLESYKAEIISLFQNDNTSASIVSILENKYNFKITEYTIKTCLQEWNICKQNHSVISDIIFHTQLKILFFQNDLEKKKLLHTLQNKKFEIISKTLKRLWFQLGLQHCMNSTEAQQQVNEIIQIIQNKLEKETIERYKKELLHCHF